MTLLDWAALLSAFILAVLGVFLVFQLGYARGRRDAEKERGQAEPMFPNGRILRPPERPS